MNPVTEFRTTTLNYSLNEFAKAAHVSRVAVQRTESGCYPQVPPAITQLILDHPTLLADGTSLLSDEEINAAYSLFQTRTRRLTYLHGLLTPSLPITPPFTSPVVHWRLTSGVPSQLLFCKLLCLHPHVVNQVETGRQTKLPKQMLAALEEAGYDDELIEELSRRQAIYSGTK